MREEDVLKVLAECGALIKDTHVVLKNGGHSSVYVNKDALYTRTGHTCNLASQIAHETHIFEPEAVIGPALGGIALSQWVGYHLSNYLEQEVLSVFAEKNAKTGKFELNRGYDKLVFGKRVLVVEDVLTTGRSAKEVIDLVRSHDGKVVGVGALVNRGAVMSGALMVPQLRCLVYIESKSWPEEDCPLCFEKVPINTDVGHGRAYLERRAAQEA